MFTAMLTRPTPMSEIIHSRWRHFTLEEFDCRCGCGTNQMDLLFVDRLDAYRTLVGAPMEVTSGYRCINHPDERDKSLPGTHTEGIASDFFVGSPILERLLLLALIDPEMHGYGVDQVDGHKLLHLDMGETKPGRTRPYFWTY